MNASCLNCGVPIVLDKGEEGGLYNASAWRSIEGSVFCPKPAGAPISYQTHEPSPVVEAESPEEGALKEEP